MGNDFVVSLNYSEHQIGHKQVFLDVKLLLEKLEFFKNRLSFIEISLENLYLYNRL